VFNTAYKHAFNKLKKQLVFTLLLSYFNYTLLIMLETDALDRVIASILF
jgi:hypothetical protein